MVIDRAEALGLAGGASWARLVLLSHVLSWEPAWWKRYRGDTAGKL